MTPDDADRAEAVKPTVPMAGGNLDFPGGSTDETALLHQFLHYLRQAVLRKVYGLTDEQARWTPEGRLIPLIGIVNHLTRMEWRWIDGGFAGAQVEHDENEFNPDPQVTLEAVVASYEERADRTDAMARSTPLTTIGSGWAEGHDLRFVLLHLIDETARHAGHADATREMLDGVVGL